MRIRFIWLWALVNTVMIFKVFLCTFVAGGNTAPSVPYLTLFWGGGRGTCGVSPRLRAIVFPYWASRSHSLDTPQSVGLLWTTHQPNTETSCLTTHNNHNRQTSLPPAGFKPTIPKSDPPPQVHVLDHVTTGIGFNNYLHT